MSLGWGGLLIYGVGDTSDQSALEWRVLIVDGFCVPFDVSLV
jgi:hypothetical protein